ncbi:MAG: spore coat protein CotJB [Ruminococcus sp.]|nr:spore coat protein CotJB [Ruminococcus sp.]
MNKRNMLLNKIRKYDFAIKELNLYLNMHPNCRRALALFDKYRNIKKTAEDEYVQNFGPIVPEQSSDPQHWSWIDDPWPWERS